MVYFLAGCAILLVILFGARLLSRANPHKLALGMRKAAGVALFAVAGFLALRGALPIAIPIAAFALTLVGGSGAGGFGGGFGSAQKSQGQTSHVETERLEMELDHDSGYMDGKVLAGRFSGRALSSLSDREAIELYNDFAADRLKEASLMEAYLDWRIAGWREQAEDAAAANAGRARSRGARMSADEARAVLEVGPDASEDDIRQAHRRLMMKMHPDHGGSTYLAARINEAKEVLLGS